MSFVLLSLTTLLFASCYEPGGSFISISEAETIIPGAWRVDYYTDGKGTTADVFTEYSITFKNDGTLTVNDGVNTYPGTWVISIANEDPTYDEQIDITVTGSDIMTSLSKIWLVTDMNDNRMNLMDGTGQEEIYLLRTNN